MSDYGRRWESQRSSLVSSQNLLISRLESLATKVRNSHWSVSEQDWKDLDRARKSFEREHVALRDLE